MPVTIKTKSGITGTPSGLVDGELAVDRVGGNLWVGNDGVSVPLIGNGGSVKEAPIDGSQYARINAGWAVVAGGGGIGEAPIDGTQYGRQDAGWTSVSETTGVEEAPINGSRYARLNAAWNAITGPDVPFSTGVNRTLRADGVSGWVEEDSVRILPDGMAIGTLDNNWATLAISDGTAVPASGVSSPYDSLAIIGSAGVGMAIITGNGSGTSSIAMGDSANIQDGYIAYNNGLREMVIHSAARNGLRVTATGSNLGNIAGAGAKLQWEGASGGTLGASCLVDSSNNFIIDGSTSLGNFQAKCQGAAVWTGFSSGAFTVHSLGTGAVYSSGGTLTNTPTVAAQAEIDSLALVLADLTARIVVLETP
jgi:hypothetical protein